MHDDARSRPDRRLGERAPSLANELAHLTQKAYAIVLAGGRGSRLGALTDWRAKPAVPFAGKFRIIDFTLSNCVNSGVRRIGVATQLRFFRPADADTMTTNLFPMVLTNVTAAQLLAVYRQHLTNGCTVVVDEMKQEIRVEPTQAEKIKRWLKQKLRL